MTETTARLAEPISNDAPCGIDLDGDPVLYEIRDLARGKPATWFSNEKGGSSPEQEPKWSALRDLCEITLRRSIHLEVALYYIVSRLAIDGLEGEAEGLELLATLLERHWPNLFPKLDATEGNDPIQRINILRNLTTPVGSYEDPIRFVERVRRVPIVIAARIGPVSIEAFSPRDSADGGDGKVVVSWSQVESILAELPAPEVSASRERVARSVDALQNIEKFLEQTVGVGEAPSWDSLEEVLRQQTRFFANTAGGGAVPGALGNTSALSEKSAAPSSGHIGAIQSRDDVVRAIGAICEYYRHNEPSSPVPFLLKRAEGLVSKNFLDVIADLAPGASDTVRSVTGPSGQ